MSPDAMRETLYNNYLLLGIPDAAADVYARMVSKVLKPEDMTQEQKRLAMLASQVAQGISPDSLTDEMLDELVASDFEALCGRMGLTEQ